MTTSLNSHNALNNTVHLLVEATSRCGNKSSYVLTYDDTAGDYGDAFTTAEGLMLAQGMKVTRPDGCGGQTVTLCMITATRGRTRTI